jgi:hypothetical protein
MEQFFLGIIFVEIFKKNIYEQYKIYLSNNF